MLQLKNILHTIELSQAALARELGVSRSTMSDIINHSQWPKNARVIKRHIRVFLKANGANPDQLNEFDKPHAPASANDDAPEEEEIMLLRRQTLTPEAKRVFKVVRNPFDDVRCADDMWISPDIRYVRESMLQTAKFGGFLAVVGESGAGKTSVMLDLEDRIARDGLPIVLIRPYVLAAEDNDKKGKTLKSTHIAEAILRGVAPLESVKASPEARFAQLHRALLDSHNSGYKHCIVIEEAHSLPIPTLKHLKRILELQQGFNKLISIILIGQPELLMKLSERNREVREVVQRCEVAELRPIQTNELPAFLGHRFKQCGRSVGDILNDEGIAALTELLVTNTGESQLYPLAVGNVLISAMNVAARIGMPVVDGSIIKEVVAGL